MDIRKGQQDFGRLLEAPLPPIPAPASPVNVGIPGYPQKTLSEGPVFDFGDPSIAEAENALRASVKELKQVLETLSAKADSEEGYAGLRAGLDARMPGLYRCYDRYVSSVLATGTDRVTCGRACSHCCSHYVTSVEPYELLYLDSRIRKDSRYPSRVIGMHRRAALFNSLRDGRTDDEAEDRALYRYYLRNQPCPFLLQGGVCGVYDSRPMSCRMFYSLSHPSLCKGKSVIAPGNRNFLIELPEDIEADIARAGALFMRFDLPESLFEGLLKVNEVFGRFDGAGSDAGDGAALPDT